MSEKLTRIYKKLDIKDVHEHLMIYGDLSASCANCQSLDLKLEDATCPKCSAEFKYVSFRNIQNHLPKMYQLLEDRPQTLLVDYDDYKRNIGQHKAKEFLK